MGKGNERVCAAEAAALLGVTVRTLSTWTRRGWLTPSYEGRTPRYDRAAVEMFAGLRARRVPIDALAAEAKALAERAERRIQVIEILLGIERAELSHDPKEMALFRRRLRAARCRTDAEARTWAARLGGVDETYLARLRAVTGDPEAPKALAEDAAHLVMRAHLAVSGNALALLEAACERVRRLSFAGERSTPGRLPPEDLTEQLLAVLVTQRSAR